MTESDDPGSQVEGSLRLRWRWLILLATLGPVLVVTLTPSAAPGWAAGGPLCFVCGFYGGANVVRNVILFVPLGAALALLLGPGRRALLTVLAITVSIEAIQMHLPGRNPLLVDVVANFTGGALSVLLVRWAPWWINPPVWRGAALSLAWAAAASAVLLTTALLFTVDLPRSTYWGQWTPALGHLERYEGTVRSASVGDVSIPSRRLGDSEVVRRALLSGGPVRVEAESGPPTSGIAPMFSIYDQARREIVLLGVDGDDLVARPLYRANRFRFDRPDMRLRGAFRNVSAGETVHLEFILRGGESCLALNDRRECGVAPGLEQGWALLMFPEGAPRWFGRTLAFGWMMGLVFPFAFFARRHALSLGGGVLLLGTAFSGWWLPAVSPLSGLAGFGIVVGVLLGAGVRRWVEWSRPVSS